MIRHVSGIAEVADDFDVALDFYRDVLGIQVEHEEGRSYAVVQVPGLLHFGIWDRESVAEAVYGDPEGRERVPLGFTVGFEVDSVEEAREEIERTAE